MAFERLIVRHEDCPRCNAIADIRIDQTDEEPPAPGVVMLSLVCPKCKLVRAAGMTTKKILVLEEKERKLMRALTSEAISETDKARIHGKLRDVQNRLDRARLGL